MKELRVRSGRRERHKMTVYGWEGGFSRVSFRVRVFEGIPRSCCPVPLGSRSDVIPSGRGSASVAEAA